MRVHDIPYLPAVKALTINLLLVLPLCAVAQSTIDSHGSSSGHDTPEALHFAAADKSTLDTSSSETADPGAAAPEECAQFSSADADVGDVIRAGCKPTLAQMSNLMNNPVGNVAMWWNQIDYYGLNNPQTDESANKTNYMGIIQWPQKLTSKWNLINRVIYNVPSVPIDQDKVDGFGSFQGALLPPSNFRNSSPIDVFDGRTTGFGDMYYVGLFSPAEPIKAGNGNIVWGLGFDVGFPTASEDVLGSGKYTAGPSALGVYLGPKWKFGALFQQYFSYAGDSDRANVNMTNLQYFYYYSLTPTVSIGAGPNIIANWEQKGKDRFTVPIGLGINKTVNFGKVPVRIGLEVYYSAIQPDNVPGTEWNMRFYMIPAVPSALFKRLSTPLFGD